MSQTNIVLVVVRCTRVKMQCKKFLLVAAAARTEIIAHSSFCL